MPFSNMATILPPPTIPRVTSLTDEQLVHVFLDMYLPKETEARYDSNHQWLRLASFLPNPITSLRLSLRALALSRIGWLKSDESIISEGRSTYTAALSALQETLSNTELARRDDTLAATHAIATYELLEATSYKGWNAHLKGLSSIYQLRGPDSFKSPLARSMLEHHRGPAMFHALQFRRVSFLTTPEWRATLEWEADIQQPLFDIGLRLAALLYEQDRHRGSIESSTIASPSQDTPAAARDAHGPTTPDIDTLLSELNEFADLNSELEKIYPQLTSKASELGTALFWDQPTMASSRHPPLQFPSLFLARATMNYWAIQCLVSSAIAALVREIRAADPQATASRSPDSASSGSPPAEPSIDNLAGQHTMVRCHELAMLTVRGVDYCCQDAMGLAGPQRCIFPIRAALVVLEQGANTEDLAFAKWKLEELSSKRGVDYAKQLTKLGYRWEEIMRSGG